jgi:hypothetical protein
MCCYYYKSIDKVFYKEFYPVQILHTQNGHFDWNKKMYLRILAVKTLKYNLPGTKSYTRKYGVKTKEIVSTACHAEQCWKCFCALEMPTYVRVFT